ncbi:MAG: hypothetical protein LBE12_15850 [Planctomycetaceae bacterium]|nr:hypothetical protein [Planctomycetaceae bacterium]
MNYPEAGDVSPKHGVGVLADLPLFRDGNLCCRVGLESLWLLAENRGKVAYRQYN